MPWSIPRLCNWVLCPEEAVSEGRCAKHKRGTATQRGYTSKKYRANRRAVLRRDPFCTCADPECKHPRKAGSTACMRTSTHSDHWPTSRYDLVLLGVPDPDSPARMRGMCFGCHSRNTNLGR